MDLAWVKELIEVGELPEPDELGFYSLTRPDGQTAVIDSLTIEFLSSDKPAPAQADLDAVFARAERVVVQTSRGEPGDIHVRLRTVHESKEPEALTALHRALRIREGEDFGHCMCLGEPHLQLRDASGETLAQIGVHHGESIRWDGAWSSDAPLSQGRELMSWLNDHGFPGLLTAFEEAEEEGRRRMARFQREWRSWCEAAPASVRPCLDLEECRHDRWDLEAIATALSAEADEASRCLSLLAWYAGERWSGYSSWESIPGDLLKAMPQAQLLATLEEARDPQVLLGGARYLAYEGRELLSNASGALLTRLLERSLECSSEDTHARARAAFAPPAPAAWRPLAPAKAQQLGVLPVSERAKLVRRLADQGALLRANLELLAYLGAEGVASFAHGPQRVMYSGTGAEGTFELWAQRLGWWGDEVAVRAAIAAARLVQPLAAAEESPLVSAAIQAAEAWALQPGPITAERAEEASDAFPFKFVNEAVSDYVSDAAHWAAWAAAGANPFRAQAAIHYAAIVLRASQPGAPQEPRACDPEHGAARDAGWLEAVGEVRAAIRAELEPWLLGLRDPVRERS